ncbi:MAG: TetR/AcrR family transcriptional regulator [Arthrobacter sp.]|jgi:AcrR family transcriptional regulator|nr:TetR/AcrR family transcriptional regulator [Arthrobacter sp.]
MPSISSPGATSSGAKRGRPGYDQATVLKIAVQAFTEFGYDATSMGMLAERLGISKSAIYHHVPSKVEILRLALDSALTPLEAVFSDAANAEGDALQRLRGAVSGTLRVLFEQQTSVTLLLRLRGNSEVELAAMQRRRALDRHAANLVSAAQAEGSVRLDLSASTVARFLFGTVNSLTEWYRPGGNVTEEEAERTVLAILFDGLVPRG